MSTHDDLGSIAIIGMSGRFPKAQNLEEFWHNLAKGVEAISFFSDEELIKAGENPEVLHNPNYVRASSVLENHDLFDASFFGFSPREAELTDPQHRIFMECAWHALENAGYTPETPDIQIGVFAGSSISRYLLLNLFPHLDFSRPTNYLQKLIGNDKDYLATHLSYKLNLKGPSISVQTACSTSLVAVVLACQSLLSYQCDLALAGGVTVSVPQKVGYAYEEGSILSPDGHCRSFSASAQGTIYGSGVGLVVLKRLEDALADKDQILAVIKGAAINNDGALKVGYTAPSVDGQAEVIAMAHALAEIDAETITYVEAHATGTPLGDPIEIAALTQVFRASTNEKGFCAIGSVKTNVGHLDAAAGVAGLIKTVLALKHKSLPPSLHFDEPNPEIDFANSPFYVNTKLSKWETNGTPRRAGVSSFGFGGTNAHVVLEEAPIKTLTTNDVERPWHILTLSAKNQQALHELAFRYKEYFASNTRQASLSDISFTANTGRTHFPHRLALVAESTSQLREQLAAFTASREIAGVVTGELTSQTHPKVAFLFTGQGSQYIGMGRQLYETEPTFRLHLDRCHEILAPLLEKPLLEVLYPKPGMNSPLDETIYTQPALFALEYALAELWKSWGIEPSIVIGHSIGEYVAACVAGLFSLEDALKLCALRGRLMQALPHTSRGEMAVVFASEEQVAATISLEPHDSQKVAIAAINGPRNTVISGESQAVQAICAALETQGIKSKKLKVSHAFHSPLMDPMISAFERAVAEVTFSPPQIDIISNVTGALITTEMATPEYWCRHVRQPVRFATGMQTLHQQGAEVLIEIGPKPTLLGMGRQCLPEKNLTWLPSLHPIPSDWQQILQSLATLYVRGVPVDWSRFDQDYADARSRVELPTYPFQRQRYWVEREKLEAHHTPFSQNGSRSIHPLLGLQRFSATLKNQEKLFESQIRYDSPAYLADHRIYQKAILPATAYLEMALAAGAVAFKSDDLALEEVTIPQALILPTKANEVKTVQLVLTPLGEKVSSFQIFSLITDQENDEPSWTPHAFGKVLVGDKPSSPQVNLATLQAQCTQEISVEDYYEQLRAQGIDYGPTFQAIEQLWRGEGQALGQIRLPSALVLESKDYKLHPVLLDTCLQVLAPTFSEHTEQDIYLPMGLERLRVYRRPSERLWSHAKMLSKGDSSQQTLTAELHLFDNNGNVVAQLEGLSVMRASREALLRSLQKDLGDWLYQIAWQPKERFLNKHPHTHTGSGSWLIFANHGETGFQLANLLSEYGDDSILVSAGPTYQKLAATHYQINPAKPQDFQQLLQEIMRDNQAPYRGIVHLWSIAEGQDPSTLTALQDTQLLNCGSVLHLVQAIAKVGFTEKEATRLWLVTQGAQSVETAPDLLQVQQASLWGLGRVIALEHPELQCVLIDLDPSEREERSQSLLEELCFPDIENQIAYRHGVRHVARLVRHPMPDIENLTDGSLALASEPHKFTIQDYGILENLTPVRMMRRQPGPREVEIEVRATGLNFRDVLNALGMLKEYSEQLGIESAADMPFGGECAGVIRRVGEEVEALQVGDEVIAAVAIESLASFVTVQAEFVVPKPQNLSFEEAATIPTAFLTAYYGLQQLAKIQRGDKVLIHSAAGGVGQAAVQLAQACGAEILATASPSKWPFLKSMGVERVMNSRTLNFVEEVMEYTSGQGVNIVLNSLNGEFIAKSFEVLGKGGRFVELGKIGIWDEHQVLNVRPDVSYFSFDLLDVSLQNPGLITEIFKKIVQKISQDDLKPLPNKVFPIEETVNAFRYMAQAKHIGKVVISQPQMAKSINSEDRKLVQEDSSYLITGGLGALGLQVANFLVKQGAKHLVLTGRSGASNQEAVRSLEQNGAKVLVVKGDVSNQQELTKVLATCQALAPLRGIIHAAGVLDDGVLLQQNWQRFRKVMAPKVEGAWNLHTLTQNIPLDFFVCFSSAASLLGSPGQANYAAANAFMDALAHHRQAQNLPGLSINWGPWAKSGMAAELDQHSKRLIANRGLSSITPEQGLYVLEQLLRQGAVQVGVLPVNWSKFMQQLPTGAYPTLLSELAPQVRTSEKKQQEFEIRRRLEETTPDNREELLVAYLQAQGAKVLGLAPSQLEPQYSLNELGLSSLMGIELKNRITTELGVNIPIQKFIEAPSMTQLAKVLLEQLTLASIVRSQPPSADLSDDLEVIKL